MVAFELGISKLCLFILFELSVLGPGRPFLGFLELGLIGRDGLLRLGLFGKFLLGIILGIGFLGLGLLGLGFLKHFESRFCKNSRTRTNVSAH